MGQLNFSPFLELTTERLHLRQLQLSDDLQIQALRSDERVNRYIQRAASITVEEARAFVEKINGFIAINQSMYWAITLKGSDLLIGTICVWNFAQENSVAEIGYELQPDYQKKGIMQEALISVLNYIFKELSLQTVEACVNDSNVDSVKLLLRNHFVNTGEELPDVPGFMIYALESTDFNQ